MNLRADRRDRGKDRNGKFRVRKKESASAKGFQVQAPGLKMQMCV